MKQTNSRPKKRGTPHAPPRVSDDAQKSSTRIPYFVFPSYLLDIPDANVLRLLLFLIRDTRAIERPEIYGGHFVTLAPRSGILKPGVLAVKWHTSKSNVRRWFRWLKSHKYVEHQLHHDYSTYSLTKQAFPVIDWLGVEDRATSSVTPTWNTKGMGCLTNNYALQSKNRGNTPSSLPKKIACPECKGRGDIWNVKEQEATPCPTCKGKKIIWREDYEALQEIKKLPPRKLVPIKK